MKQFLINLSMQRRYWAILILVGIALECSALYYQYVLGEWPCLLCIHIRMLIFAFNLREPFSNINGIHWAMGYAFRTVITFLTINCCFFQFLFFEYSKIFIDQNKGNCFMFTNFFACTTSHAKILIHDNYFLGLFYRGRWIF